jgi:hypothetical protein
MKTMETTEEVSSHPGKKRHWSQKRHWNIPGASERPRLDWKKGLANLWSGRKVKTITKKTYASRGQETKWEMSGSGRR